MNKYVLLLLLNAPFVFFGVIKALALYRTNKTNRGMLAFRLFLWGVVASGLVFAEPIYNYLTTHGLTDSTPLSLPDVVLTTGLVFAMFMCLRLYGRLDAAEKRISDLHEKLSILLSDNDD